MARVVVLAFRCIFDEVSCAESTPFRCVTTNCKLIPYEQVMAAKPTLREKTRTPCTRFPFVGL